MLPSAELPTPVVRLEDLVYVWLEDEMFTVSIQRVIAA